MDLEQQLELVRKNKHLAYLKHIANIEIAQKEEINDKNVPNKNLNILPNLPEKEKAAFKIQKFIKKYWFCPECINTLEMRPIPPLYRFRVNITTYHINEYSEINVSNDMLKMHRLIHNMALPFTMKEEKPIILFRYCFDIRILYIQRNQIIELYDNFYFMQPSDHERIISCWNKVNGETNFSIRYLSDYEYVKSLTEDRVKN